MNGQLMEYWGRTMLMALQGQKQTDSLANLFQRAYQNLTRLNANMFQIWELPAPATPPDDLRNCNQQICDAFMRMQQLSLQWIGMFSNIGNEAQVKKIAQLEKQVEEQARTIEHLQSLMGRSETGNSEIVSQFQKLIEQQSRQFQQLTASVGEYLKSGASKTEAPKQS